MEHSIKLEGLHENNPRDFLAALGLLRLIALIWPQLHARMGWGGSVMTARIVTDGPLPDDWNEEAVTALQSLLKHDPDPVRHGKVVTTTVGSYRKATKRALKFQLDPHEPLAALPALLYATYSSQMQKKNSDAIEPSWFSFGNGQGGKNLLKDVGDLINSLTPSDLIKSLKGEVAPEEAKTLRWNPAEFRPAAYRGPDPGAEVRGDKILDFPVFNVLAFLGLTFFPSVPTIKGGKTLGFVESNDRKYFQWPIWKVSLGCDELATLLQAAPQVIESNRGVVRKWRSRRFSSNKSVYFSPAESLC